MQEKSCPHSTHQGRPTDGAGRGAGACLFAYVCARGRGGENKKRRCAVHTKVLYLAFFPSVTLNSTFRSPSFSVPARVYRIGTSISLQQIHSHRTSANQQTMEAQKMCTPETQARNLMVSLCAHSLKPTCITKPEKEEQALVTAAQELSRAGFTRGTQ